MVDSRLSMPLCFLPNTPEQIGLFNVMNTMKGIQFNEYNVMNTISNTHAVVSTCIYLSIPVPSEDMVHGQARHQHSMQNVPCVYVNTPATGQLAKEDENKPAHCFAFFSASQKTLKFKSIR